MEFRNIGFPLVTRVLTTAISVIFAGHACSSLSAQDAKVSIKNDKITVAPKSGAVTNARGEVVTGSSTYSISVPTAANGSITPSINNSPQDVVTLGSDDSFDITLNEGINTIVLSYKPEEDDKPGSSVAFNVEFDDTGPILQKTEAVMSPVTGTTVLITFAEDDLNPSIVASASSAANALTITRQDNEGKFLPGVQANNIPIQSAEIDGRHLRIPVLSMPAGQYQLTITPANLTDVVGNPAEPPLTTLFAVLPGREFGEHVEFPPFAPHKKQNIPPEGFNPGDYVETRVARLYYFRDAHRVAQIINRNIRSFNQAAVTQAERRAENSRDDADAATDERRAKERAAVRAAEQARNAENKLAQAQQQLAEAEQLQTQIDSDTVDKGNLNTDTEQNEIEALQRKITKNENLLKDRYGSIDELGKKVQGMQQSVANLRETELAAREASDVAQAKEDRARATQFRDEVTAAETDPDTYVAGDLNSVDPVSQCSISVIGEGLIQIRGPIKGINTIRTMINQIDSPVGQIKIGIFTVQVNGEKGEKMEKAVGDAEGYVDLARFLVNQSLQLLRRAIQSEASEIAQQCDLQGHYQVDRDRRYLYAFFGRDFIDELYEMNSEFLFTENKLLSLHAMDTVSLNRALFILALAKNDVRERIVTRFLESVKTELPDAEFDFRRSSELNPHHTLKHSPFWNRTRLPIKNHYERERVIHEAVHRNALQRYHFRNFSAFFDTGFTHADTMNPMQREFIRLAQIYKARLIAEIEWRQRVIERGLIEDRSNDEDELFSVLTNIRDKAYEQLRLAYEGILAARAKLSTADAVLWVELEIGKIPSRTELRKEEAALAAVINGLGDAYNQAKKTKKNLSLEDFLSGFYKSDGVKIFEDRFSGLQQAKWLSSDERLQIKEAIEELKTRKEKKQTPPLATVFAPLYTDLANRKEAWEAVPTRFRAFRNDILSANVNLGQLDASTDALKQTLKLVQDTELGSRLNEIIVQLYVDKQKFLTADDTVKFVKEFLEDTRAPLDHRKLLDYLIDQQEEKFIELVEGTRSHIAVIDQYLKRLSIALEDDFKVQFYDPAFIRVREAARQRQVTLSQVERTTILTNNRDFAKVDPQATIEFDLPKRQIAIKEAFDAAKALVEDTGALVNDPTFLAAFQMMGGSNQPATVKNLIPSQSMSTDQHVMGLVPPQPPEDSAGSALQSLVPEPAIYKLETGTGFQIRPVMQPDGDSAVYDFDYMYTTNIREPVRADEKHLGRVKRHFVHTAVQTGNFELREVSRYQVALKVSRTGRGVPLLEDIPILGIAFRPAPSDESSLQQNIIFGQTNLYPTLFDLMGLRWAQQVVDLDHANLLESEHVIRGRQKSVRDYVFGTAASRVDGFLGLTNSSEFRPDLYHAQTRPSPHHPRGYDYQGGVQDPTKNNFERIDRRPPEMQEPPYDRYRHVPIHPERIEPSLLPAHENVYVDPPSGLHSGAVSRPQSDAGEFESLLSRGLNEPVEQNARPRINDGAVHQPRFVPVQGHDRSKGGMLESDQFGGRLQAASMMPRLRPVDAIRPQVRSSSPVVPASFESNDSTNRRMIQRLPPVNN